MYVTCSCGNSVPKGMKCTECSPDETHSVGRAHGGSIGPHGLPLLQAGYDLAASDSDDD